VKNSRAAEKTASKLVRAGASHISTALKSGVTLLIVGKIMQLSLFLPQLFIQQIASSRIDWVAIAVSGTVAVL
jgi:hypothetical protein